MDKEKIKYQLGKLAVDLIKKDTIVGLGSGSTVSCFIRYLAEKCKEGLSTKAVASSNDSWDLAESLGIDVVDINDVSHIDITIDGADEIDNKKRLIKGAGGALLREKILINFSENVVILADYSKIVDHLGKRPLPIEVVLFGAEVTKKKIEEIGYKGKFRVDSENEFLITDNGNLILDVFLPKLSDKPEKDHEAIIHVPGVVDTGFFFNSIDKIAVGQKDGSIKIIE